jgi:hypothetical protein
MNDLLHPTPDLLDDADLLPVRTDLAPDAALDRLRAGLPVENARVVRLKFRGTFSKPVRFRNCLLVRPEFDGAEFADEVAFAHCTLDRPACARGAMFAKDLSLTFSTLNKAAFRHLTVRGELAAAGVQGRGKLLFDGCVFEGRVGFWEARLKGWVEFKNCLFAGEADFRSLHAEEGFVLAHSEFRGDCLFRGATVAKNFAADGSRFDRLLDFSKAKFQDYVYLEAIDQGRLMRLGFLNAIAERVLVRPEQVDGRLASEDDGRHADAMQEYGLLKKSFAALNRYDHEDWAFYRFKVSQRRAAGWTVAKPWTAWRAFAGWLFLDLGCGYGTDPLRAVRMALAIILGFAALYGANVTQFYAEKLPFPEAAATDPENRAAIGLITSVSVFTSGMGGIREVAKGWMNVPIMVESLMGTLLFGLFIVAFSRKVIR